MNKVTAWMAVTLFCCAPLAQADRLANVSILVNTSGKEIPTAGTLYKLGAGNNSREFVAMIAEDGSVDPPFDCQPSERMWAEPSKHGVLPNDQARLCKPSMVFRFYVPAFADTSSFVRASALANAGDAGLAVKRFSEMAAQARANGDTEGALVASNAAVAQVAAALGDTRLSTLVTRDVAQNNRLVLTGQGEEKVIEFQKKANLRSSGKVDFATQKAMAMEGLR